jgi:ABC-type antimicrobial peptide transport system permease subunit
LACTTTLLGIYGVVSITASQRQRELAVRIALGVSRGNTVRLVIGQAMPNAGIGTLLGLTGAWPAQRFVRGFLFQISPVDPSTFVIGAVLLLLIAVIGSGIPLRAQPESTRRNYCDKNKSAELVLVR